MSTKQNKKIALMKEQRESLTETLPAPPILSKPKKTIIWHGVLYAFPEYSDEQLTDTRDAMIKVNESYKYSQLNSMLDRLQPYRVGLAKRRSPGEKIVKDSFVISMGD